MSDNDPRIYFDRQPGETATGYAERMRELVEVIQGRVSVEAGRWVDFDDVLEDLEWIISQPRDAERKRVWELQLAIGKIVDRMTSVSRLQRVLVYVTELAR